MLCLFASRHKRSRLISVTRSFALAVWAALVPLWLSLVPAASCVGACPGWGPELTVNQNITNRQEQPAVAVLANGDIAVVWASWADNRSDIKGRVFDPRGYPRTPDFSVTDGSWKAMHPRIAALDDGSFVAVWDDENPNGGTLRDIFGRIMKADGTAIASSFQVNMAANSYQQNPDVAALPGGGFAVVWEDLSGGTWQLRARAFLPFGIPLQEILVNQERRGGRGEPRIAVTTTLTHQCLCVMISWRDQSGFAPPPPEPNYDPAGGVRARLFDLLLTPNGDELAINKATHGAQYGPGVAAVGATGFVVAFADDSSRPTTLKSRSFKLPDKELDEEEKVLSPPSPGDQGKLAIAGGADSFAAAWEDRARGSNGIRIRVMSSRDMRDLIISENDRANQATPALALFRDERMVVVWTDTGGSGAGDIKMRIESPANPQEDSCFAPPPDVGQPVPPQPVQPGPTGSADRTITFGDRSWISVAGQRVEFHDSPSVRLLLLSRATFDRILGATGHNLNEISRNYASVADFRRDLVRKYYAGMNFAFGNPRASNELGSGSFRFERTQQALGGGATRMNCFWTSYFHHLKSLGLVPPDMSGTQFELAYSNSRNTSPAVWPVFERGKNGFPQGWMDPHNPERAEVVFLDSTRAIARASEWAAFTGMSNPEIVFAAKSLPRAGRIDAIKADLEKGRTVHLGYIGHWVLAANYAQTEFDVVDSYSNLPQDHHRVRVQFAWVTVAIAMWSEARR